MIAAGIPAPSKRPARWGRMSSQWICALTMVATLTLCVSALAQAKDESTARTSAAPELSLPSVLQATARHHPTLRAAAATEKSLR